MFIVCLALSGSLAVPAVSIAQASFTSETDTAAERLTIESRLAAVESSSELDEAQRSSAAAAYRQAITALQQLDEQRLMATSFDELISSGREQISAIGERIKAVEEQRTSKPEISAAMPVEELRPRLEKAQADIATQTTLLQSLRSDLDTQTKRPDLIRDEIARTNIRLSELERERASLAADTSLAPSVRDARKSSVRLQQAADRMLLERLDKELVAAPIRLELLEAQRREAATMLENLEAHQTALEGLLAAAQRSEALATIVDAGVHIPTEIADNPVVKTLRDDNRETAAVLRQLADRSEEARRSRKEVATLKAQVIASFERARRQLQVAGSNELVGRILLDERRTLPDLSEYRSRAAHRETLVKQAGLRGIELETELEHLDNPEHYIEGYLQKSPGANEVVADTVRLLVQGRTELLRQASNANDQYLTRLSELAFEEDGLMQVIAEFEAFLVENLLWVRTRDVFGPDSLPELIDDIRDFADPSWWHAAISGLARILKETAGLIASALLAIWLIIRGRVLAALRATAEGVGKPSEDSFGRTLRAVFLTFLMDLPLAAYLIIIGVLLKALANGTEASLALGSSLMIISPLFFSLFAARAVCLPDGLAIAHFKWNQEAVSSLRHQISILLVSFLLPACFLVLLAERSGRVGGGELLRMLMVVQLAGLSLFFYRLFARRGGIAAALEARSFNGTEPQRRWLWLGIGVLIPVVLAAQALTGYVYSAGALLSGLILTLWLLAGALLIHEVIYRWLLVTRRRIRLQQLLARREAQRGASDDDTNNDLSLMRTDLDTSVDISSLDSDTRKLIRIAIMLGTVGGIYWIWSDMLPALNLLDTIGLWETDAGTGPDEPHRTVTLADFLLGLAVLALTYVGATTLPSVIEIILSQRPGIAHGSRVAFATLTRYFIVVIGAFLAFNLLGASWSKLQWLVAALGVGIGFGLQEIVANFISGLIILVERPVRVGDVVTVGEVEGVVSRIQIRATTVMNWQHQEHLVPNKEFITGRVKNWSLTSEVTRLEVPVGIAYGSDTDLALATLAEIAAEHPKVLEEPAPFIGFLSFGDNALGLELRCFVANIGDRLSTLTDLHRTINRRFEQAGIIIAFPQRDVHLDVSSPLEINLQDRKDDVEKPTDS